MKYITKVLKFLRCLGEPVLKCFTFFFSFWAIITSSSFGYMFAYLTSWPSVKDAIKYICVGALISYLATLLVSWARKGWPRFTVKAVFYVVALSFMAVYAFLWQNFEMKISPHTLTLVIETNSSETNEFFDSYLFNSHSYIAYGITAGVLLLLGLVEWKTGAINRYVRTHLWTRYAVRGVVGVMCAVGLFNVDLYPTLTQCRNSKQLTDWETKYEPWPADLLTSLYYSYYAVRAAQGDIELATKATKDVFKTKTSVAEPDSLDVVFVFGESYIKWHSSLYGYDHKTTPYMERERDRGNLFVFNDVISPYNATSVVEKNTFSCNSMCHGENWFELPMFPTVFRHAGYNVYFWDMQRNYQKHKMYTMTVNAYVYNPEISRMTYNDTVVRHCVYDGTLIDNFRDSSHVTPGKYNLVMFHLLGQHVNAKDRYPDLKKFKIFTKDSVTIKWDGITDDMRQFISEYDNATYYNDVIMYRIFNMYRYRNAVVVYFSDHGDEAYDYRDQKGRFGHENPDWQHLKYQNDVPFVIWCSDIYKQRHPEVIKEIQAAVDRPFMIDNACQVLFHLGGIKTPYYKSDRDLISPDFKPVKRKVYYKYDYDSRRWPKGKGKDGGKKKK